MGEESQRGRGLLAALVNAGLAGADGGAGVSVSGVASTFRKGAGRWGMGKESNGGRGLLTALVSAVLAGALGIEAFNVTVVWYVVRTTGTSGAYYLAVLLCGGLL